MPSVVVHVHRLRAIGVGSERFAERAGLGPGLEVGLASVEPAGVADHGDRVRRWLPRIADDALPS